jgi:predicted outer membrane repeat protein
VSSIAPSYSGSLEINVLSSLDSIGSADYCYPESTSHCNLRSAWLLCNSQLSSIHCLIRLPSRSSIIMDLHYGSLELNNESSITIEGNQADVYNLNPQSRSLIYYHQENDSISNSGPILTIRNISFSNFDSFNGGAIHIDGSCQLTLESISFVKNIAYNLGGALYVNRNQHATSIVNCEFIS